MFMFKSYKSYTAWMVAILLGAAATANAAPIPGDPQTELAGAVPELGLSFSVSRDLADPVVVEIALPSGAIVRAEIDYSDEEFILRSLRPDRGGITAITAADSEAINRLPSPLPSTGAGALQEVLLGVLNLVASYPAGTEIDLSTRASTPRSSPIISLCASTGQQVTGTYTLHGKTVSDTVKLGPCYNEANACIGRCGPGCGPPPSATIQRFTQNCLNHDLCTRANGGNYFGGCTGLWLAAAKDFLFAPDCGTLTANWDDSYSFSWGLMQEGAGVRGLVSTTSCEAWSVTGSHAGAKVNLTARNPHEIKGCCTTFTYVGSLKDCNKASGTWTNECGGHGSWSMSRQGATDSDNLGAVEGDSPASAGPPERR